MAFWPFYSVPILLILLYGNRRLAVVISVVSTVAWWWADKASGHVYSNEWLRLWDATVRLIFFCLMIFAGWAFKWQRDAIRARLELLDSWKRKSSASASANNSVSGVIFMMVYANFS